MKGLCQIIVGPGVQPIHLVLHLTAGGEDQHPCLTVGLPQGSQHRHAILPRQVQVENYQIVALHAQQLQSLLPVVAVVHAVGQPPQAADDGFAQGAFVFNNQKVHESPPFTFLHVLVVLNYSKNR